MAAAHLHVAWSALLARQDYVRHRPLHPGGTPTCPSAVAEAMLCCGCEASATAGRVSWGAVRYVTAAPVAVSYMYTRCPAQAGAATSPAAARSSQARMTVPLALYNGVSDDRNTAGRQKAAAAGAVRVIKVRLQALHSLTCGEREVSLASDNGFSYRPLTLMMTIVGFLCCVLYLKYKSKHNASRVVPEDP